jgi:uncharacterized protein YdaU (DUF1376 family)
MSKKGAPPPGVPGGIGMPGVFGASGFAFEHLPMAIQGIGSMMPVHSGPDGSAEPKGIIRDRLEIWSKRRQVEKAELNYQLAKARIDAIQLQVEEFFQLMSIGQQMHNKFLEQDARRQEIEANIVIKKAEADCAKANAKNLELQNTMLSLSINYEAQVGKHRVAKAEAEAEMLAMEVEKIRLENEMQVKTLNDMFGGNDATGEDADSESEDGDDS